MNPILSDDSERNEKEKVKICKIPESAITEIWHEIELHEKEMLECSCENVDGLRLSNSLRSFLFNYGIN